MPLNRRDFLLTAPVFALGTAAAATAPRPVLKPGLNAYSFNKLLNDAIRKRGPGITLTGVLEFAAKHKFDSFDPTGYFFPGYPKVPGDAYVDEFKKRFGDLGVAVSDS